MATNRSKSPSKREGTVPRLTSLMPVARAVQGRLARSAVETHQEIQRGFGFHELEAFQSHSQLPTDLLRRMLQLPARTYQRRKIEGRLSSTESDRLWRLVRLFAQVQELFEGDTTTAAAAWLQQPAPALGRGNFSWRIM